MVQKVKKYRNNLAKEKSPYLLEHADNPVNWYAWGDEAFGLAKRENKLLFVSIGYSACHWCHVMRRESFENENVAKILNTNFVSIKVDREERPDLDHLLQITFQIMNGRGGGWPLSIFMTPDKKPFYSGTYFPVQSKYGMPGFIEVLEAVIKAYKTKINDITAQASQVEAYLKRLELHKAHNASENFSAFETIQSFAEIFDKTNGGFGQAPKFPTETGLFLLLHASALDNNSTGLNMVFKTLDEMLQGGIYDQLGGGFHRYSVDESWLVPHFEKMLYNQSLLILVLSEAFKLSKNDFYLRKIQEILAYVTREMQAPSGGFYSSQNADSEGVEGKFFVWDKKDFNFLPEESKKIFCDYYDISEDGNWEGKNILHISMSISQLSKKYNKSQEELVNLLSNTKKEIFLLREKRLKPSTDTKIISSWTALMVKAYLSAFRITEDDSVKSNLLLSARKALEHLLQMTDENSIYRIFIDNKKSIVGFLDDFQYTISAFLDYYEISLDELFYNKALSLFSYSIENFYDRERGGFYYSLESHETLITRFKDYFDSPLPSPIAYALQNALRLAYFDSTETINYTEVVEKTLQTINFNSNIDVLSLSSMIYTRELVESHFTEITVVENQLDEIVQFINQLWIPFRLQVNASINAAKIEEKEFLKGKNLLNNKTSVYICKNFVCSKPFNQKVQISAYLKSLFPNLAIKETD